MGSKECSRITYIRRHNVNIIDAHDDLQDAGGDVIIKWHREVVTDGGDNTAVASKYR